MAKKAQGKVKVALRGDKELVAKLRALDKLAQKEILTNAVTAGGLPILNDAVQNAPHLSGTLRRSLHQEVKATGKGVVSEIGTDLEYAAQREFGGEITAKQAPFLVFKINGRWVRVRSVTQKATPYLRPAFDSKKGEAVEEVAAALLQQINRLI